METKTTFIWVKKHALTIFLLAVVVVLVSNRVNVQTRLQDLEMSSGGVGVGLQGAPELGLAKDMAVTSSFLPPEPISVPPFSQADRLVITNSSLSLLVKDVAQSMEQIRQGAEGLGGFLVDSSLNAPEGTDTGSIAVRVPVEKLSEALAAFRGLAVRVTSEQVTGQDVTDQFVDLTARLAVLEKTKAKFELILDEARTVQESLEVQRELVNLQYQIDAVKGQQKYLDESAKTVRITAFLSTDELALPFAPEDAWRPEAVFRQAVRSLVGMLRGFGSVAIWAVVFVPLWLPAIIILRWLRRRFA